MEQLRLGVDIGGTFTDILLLAPDGSVHSKKVLSTPDDYSRAIQDGIAQLMGEAGIKPAAVRECSHGTTVATNAIIEHKGVKVGLITTAGFRDVLEIGRFRLPRLYDLSFRKPEPLVERRLRLEVPERIGADGEVVEPLDLEAVDRASDQLVAEGVAAIAICFMNSYVNGAHERLAVERVRARHPALTVTASTEIVPQIQEYERTSTTVVNAYIRPVVERYVAALEQKLRGLQIKAPLMFMQSSGGILPGRTAAKSPVFIIESGPAAGVVGSQRLGEILKRRNLMVLDMGGTTAKATLIEDGKYDLSPEIEVGGRATAGHRLIQGAGYIVQFPTIDIAEVGAGGGSIAWLDAGGGLQVGPQSAGAVPGPVCYDLGGTEPTVTDANLLLGYINPAALVGGDLKLDFAKAERAVAGIGARLGLDVTGAAHGIHLIANANMMRALAGVSTERGRDPRNFVLLAMGGNGAVHAVGLAETLDISTILVPPVAGLFSALGLIFADVEHQLISAFYRLKDQATPADLNATLTPMIREIEEMLRSEGFNEAKRRELRCYADVQYVGQFGGLTVPLSGFPVTRKVMVDLAEGFGRAHLRTYGYRSDEEPLRFLALKVVGRGLAKEARVPRRVVRVDERAAARSERRAYFGPARGWITTPVVPRGALGRKPTDGPLIVEEYDATTVVGPGWRASLDSWNNIVMERKARR
ncbi:MAG: hydantoinase/oxoprolinase family protein [Proteobacteria bacterium]|nr:hydantoinase/oxoprolinase family protein [Pseudomonadota bacterium]